LQLHLPVWKPITLFFIFYNKHIRTSGFRNLLDKISFSEVDFSSKSSFLSYIYSSRTSNSSGVVV
jgi:hypothetical protein